MWLVLGIKSKDGQHGDSLHLYNQSYISDCKDRIEMWQEDGGIGSYSISIDGADDATFYPELTRLVRQYLHLSAYMFSKSKAKDFDRNWQKLVLLSATLKKFKSVRQIDKANQVHNLPLFLKADPDNAHQFNKICAEKRITPWDVFSARDRSDESKYFCIDDSLISMTDTTDLSDRNYAIWNVIKEYLHEHPHVEQKILSGKD